MDGLPSEASVVDLVVVVAVVLVGTWFYIKNMIVALSAVPKVS